MHIQGAYTAYFNTTPNELREIANKMEYEWKSLQCGDSTTVTTLFGKEVNIEIRYDQEKMAKEYPRYVHK